MKAELLEGMNKMSQGHMELENSVNEAPTQSTLNLMRIALRPPSILAQLILMTHPPFNEFTCFVAFGRSTTT